MARFTTRPVIMGRHGVVTSGHYLATAAGHRIMSQGGNAMDAAVSMGLCLNLLEPHNNGLGGEAPTLVYSAREKKVSAVSGLGWAPAALSIEWCRQHHVDLIPGDGYIPACVPAMLDTWALILARFGTLSFAQAAAPAIELAENGFPLYPELDDMMTALSGHFTRHYPSTARLYSPGGVVAEAGTLFRNPDWAEALRKMCRAEAAASGKGRIAGIEAARNVFYKGEIAEKIVEFITTHPVEDANGQVHSGLLSLADLAEWRATLEEPVAFNYRGLEVYKCPTWTQGPVFLQQLAILQGYNLADMGHNSAAYLHTWIESAKLAFADREAYYGDPLCDDVPMDILLSPAYNDQRRELIGPSASPDLRPGEVGRGFPAYATLPVRTDNQRGLAGRSHGGDTTHLDALDATGNMVACTPSGGWFQASPVIDGLGFPLGTRAQMFYLNPERPNALAPHKRPRATLTPTLVTRHGHPYLAFGTQGGDCQDQWTLQFFLNVVDFGMDLQEAIDAPTVHTDHFPSSFYPRQADPLLVSAEGRIAANVLQDLERRGHKLRLSGDWEHGKVMVVRYDAGRGVLSAAASPRGMVAYALGW
jgi:gamma-glutamyltranspeptidase/glutathione hydrolase